MDENYDEATQARAEELAHGTPALVALFLDTCVLDDEPVSDRDYAQAERDLKDGKDVSTHKLLALMWNAPQETAMLARAALRAAFPDTMESDIESMCPRAEQQLAQERQDDGMARG